jgi:hypothetical protein
MIRILLAAAALTAFSPGVRAEEPALRLYVRPMPAPKPALKVQLLPELGELKPGNPAHAYLICFMEQKPFFFGKEAVANRARYQTMPLAELPLGQLRDYGGAALRQADWAARLDALDWQDLHGLQEGGLGQLPPEVGPLQVLGAALQVRLRAEVAGGRFDDALRTAKTMFALSRHLGEHPSEVANLVGLWVAHLGLNALQEMVQQPGCPNLYWALTDLPCPLVDLRKGLQGERTLVAAALGALRDDAPMTEGEIDRFVSDYCGVMSFAREQVGKPPRDLRPALRARAKDPERVRAAGRRLVEAGYAEALVRRFPPLQVILLDDKREYEVRRDERAKLLALPLWQIDARAAREEAGPAGDGLFASLLPHVVGLRRAQGALEQQIALFRHVEALRLYTAEHDGGLAARLADMTVPLPADPVTGGPFAYSVEGATARIRGTAPPGAENDAAHDVCYEVTVRASGVSVPNHRNRGAACP